DGEIIVRSKKCLCTFSIGHPVADELMLGKSGFRQDGVGFLFSYRRSAKVPVGEHGGVGCPGGAGRIKGNSFHLRSGKGMLRGKSKVGVLAALRGIKQVLPLWKQKVRCCRSLGS